MGPFWRKWKSLFVNNMYCVLWLPFFPFLLSFSFTLREPVFVTGSATLYSPGYTCSEEGFVHTFSHKNFRPQHKDFSWPYRILSNRSISEFLGAPHGNKSLRTIFHLHLNVKIFSFAPPKINYLIFLWWTSSKRKLKSLCGCACV